METLKKMEMALLNEWKKLQLELDPKVKALAMIAYYVNYKSYRSQKAYLQSLSV